MLCTSYDIRPCHNATWLYNDCVAYIFDFSGASYSATIAYLPGQILAYSSIIPGIKITEILDTIVVNNMENNNVLNIKWKNSLSIHTKYKSHIVMPIK